MRAKISVRVLVWAAVLAWPAVEAYRLHQARQQLAASTQVEQKVRAHLADSRTKADTQVARAIDGKN